MPIGNYPAIHYLLEECAASGIEEVGIVIREWGSLTEKYFERDHELEDYLEQKGKQDLLAKLKNPSLGLKVSFIKQDPNLPAGHGSPILSAKSFIDQDNFAMMFCDDLVVSDTPGLMQLQTAWQANGGSLGGLVMTSPIPYTKMSAFSTVKYSQTLQGDVRRIEKYIEKPQSVSEYYEPECFVGRAIYTPELITELEKNLQSGQLSAGEFSAWDAMMNINKTKEVGALQITGRWLTTGTPEQMNEAIKAILKL